MGAAVTTTCAIAAAAVLTASAASASVRPDTLLGSTTSITSVSASPTVSSPITISIEVLGGGGGTPTGTASVSDGTNSCQATLSAAAAGEATGSCTITELSPNTYSFNASYNGDVSFATSSTSSSTLALVAQGTPTTTISVVTPSPQVDEAIQLSVRVSDGNATATVAPTGKVTVSDGTRSCLATLSGATENGTGSCTITETTAAHYSFSASYPGDTNFMANSSTTSATANVTNDATSTTLGLSSIKIAYGREQLVKITATVKATYGGATTGSVKIKQGSTTLCTPKLAKDVASCTLTATEFAVGVYSFSAAFTATGHFSDSSSTSRNLTVVKSGSKPTISLSSTVTTFGSEQNVTITAAVNPQFSGSPTGTVTIYANKVTACRIKLVDHKGSCTLTGSELQAGTFTVKGIYGGDSNFTSADSATTTLTVNRPGVNG
jgi:hypothetical protein